MRTKLLTAIALLLVVTIVFISLAEKSNDQLASELTRRQSQQTTLGELPASTNAKPVNIQLTRQLHAINAPESNIWVVEDSGSGAFVELPFMPAKSIDNLAPNQWSQPRTIGHPLANKMGFLGAQSCAPCHQEKYSSFLRTAHHLTSAAVDTENVQGALVPPKNHIDSTSAGLSIDVRQLDGDIVQEVTFNEWKCKVPMDVVTGSGKTGRTYLFWRDQSLFQNYISYLSIVDDWIPSPGFEKQVTFARPIRVGCLECHITYIEDTRLPNEYQRDSAIWGISCERCHSPGREHVEYHQANPEEKKAKFISQPNELPRKSQLDLCGQCHSGSFKLRGEAFAYRPGDDLSAHHQQIVESNTGTGGIHTSNQLNRLSMSKCFQSSEMTCTSCHNPHQNERGNKRVFTARCVSCHEPMSCGMSDELQETQLTHGCVDCHMPIGDNEGMQLNASAGKFSVRMIDHYIRIDKEATEQYRSNDLRR